MPTCLIHIGAPGRTRTCNPQLRRLMLYPIELQALRLVYLLLNDLLASNNSKKWSGWRDSNSRPTAPKAVALPGCATPRNRLTCRCYGLRQIASIHLHHLGNKKPNKFKRPPIFGWPQNNGAPGEITSDILSSSLRVRCAHSNSLPANLSNSYRSNSPVISDFRDP